MTSATGQVTGNEWRVTPQNDGTYGLYAPGDYETVVARCYPDQNFAVSLHMSGDPMSLEDFHLSLIRRIVTLVETARIDRQVRARKLVDDGDHSDTTCGYCGRSPENYAPWGSPCVRKGCQGKYFPATRNPAR